MGTEDFFEGEDERSAAACRCENDGIVLPPLALDGSSLSLEELSDVAFRGRSAILDAGAAVRVDAARAVLDRVVAENRVVYGVTTGFGKFADVVIPKEKLGALQLNLVRSHAAGTGAPLSAPAVRAVMLLRANCLAKGFSGVRRQTLDVLTGTDAAFHARIHAARPHPGQIDSARNLRVLLANSALHESHRDCGVVQDAYALRCIPQVHGTARDAAAHARRVIEIEMNAATDNPMVFAETGTLVSGGNFHAAPVALVCDLLTASTADMASLSERRTERLVNPALSGDLPAFLTLDGGLNSGLMMIHVTAAALVSEAKSNSFPASVDSIPTSAGKEDHVSMGPIAARKLQKNVDLFETVLAIELLAAAQALDLRRPLVTSPPLEEVHRLVRARVAFWDADRHAAPAIEGARAVLAGDDLDGVLAQLD